MNSSAFRSWISLLATMALFLTPTLGWAQPPSVVKTSVVSDHVAVQAGQLVVFAVIMDHDEGWHSNTNEPKAPASWAAVGYEAWPTTLQFKLPAWAKANRVQWPKPHVIDADLAGTGVAETFEVLDGRAVIYVPVQIAPDAPIGKATFAFDLDYQSCKEVCNPPRTDTLKIDIEVVAANGTPLPNTAALAEFEGLDRASLSQPPPDEGKSSASAATASTRLEDSVFGFEIGFDTKGVVGTILLVLAALLGGFILNLTPCVLPVIPIKVMALSQTAKNPAKALQMGLVMALGVVAFWLAIGGVIAFSTSFKAAAQLISYWWFTVGIGVFVGVMGLSMLGVFHVMLPNWVYSINASHDSVRGSFMYGILTAILALPCVAPFGGAAMGIAATQGPGKALAVFASIGIGMAFPWALLSAFPRSLKFVPSAGPGSELLKQVLGLLMLAVAAFFLGAGRNSLVASHPEFEKELHWWVVSALVFVAMGWLVLQTFMLTKSFQKRAIFSTIGVVLFAGSFLWAQAQTDAARKNLGGMVWKQYTPELLKSSLDSGKVVVVDFTADWCGICKSLESAALNPEPVYSQLQSADVVAIKVDLGASDAIGWPYLTQELKQGGIPLLVIYGPGLDGPKMSRAYTKEWVLEAIGEARGQKTVSDSTILNPP